MNDNVDKNLHKQTEGNADRTRRNDEYPIIISVQSRKGGIGKSTVSIALAKHINNKYKDFRPQILIIDMDIFGTSLATTIQNHDSFNDIEIIHQNRDGKQQHANLIQLLQDAFEKGTIPDFNNDANSMVINNINDSGIYLLGSDDHLSYDKTDNDGKDGKTTYLSSSMLYDIFNRKLLIRFLERLIGRFHKWCVSNGKGDNKKQPPCYVILDNSPGYVGYLSVLERWMQDMGPTRAKFMYVTSPNIADMLEISAMMRDCYRNMLLNMTTRKIVADINDDNKDDNNQHKQLSCLYDKICEESAVKESGLSEFFPLYKSVHDMVHTQLRKNNPIDDGTFKELVKNNYSFQACLVNMAMPELLIGLHRFKLTGKDLDLEKPVSKSIPFLVGMDKGLNYKAIDDDYTDLINENLVPYNDLFKWQFSFEVADKLGELKGYKNWPEEPDRIFPTRMKIRQLQNSRPYQSVNYSFALYAKSFDYLKNLAIKSNSWLKFMESNGYTQLVRTIPSEWNIQTPIRLFSSALGLHESFEIPNLDDSTYKPDHGKFFRKRFREIQDKFPWNFDESLGSAYIFAAQMIVVRLLASNGAMNQFPNQNEKTIMNEARILDAIRNRFPIVMINTEDKDKTISKKDENTLLNIVPAIRFEGVHFAVLFSIHKIVSSIYYWRAYKRLTAIMALTLKVNTNMKKMHIPFEYYILGHRLFTLGTISINEFHIQLSKIENSKQDSGTIAFFEDTIASIIKGWNFGERK